MADTKGLPTPQEYADRHRKAFRAAFDFLNGHFPPTADADWWDNAVADAVKTIEDKDASSLTRDLVFSVFDYIDRECKLRMNA